MSSLRFVPGAYRAGRFGCAALFVVLGAFAAFPQTTLAQTARAQTAIVGEIKLIGGRRPAQGWEFCNGATMARNSNLGLFSIIGTMYGGMGKETFSLPNFQRAESALGANQERGPRYAVATAGILPARGRPVTNALVGEIRLYSGPRVPEGWLACEGQLLEVRSNSALFSILGKAYGGDGRNLFALPDLRRAANAIKPSPNSRYGPRYIIAVQGTYPSR